MKYLLDTNSLNLTTIRKGPRRVDLCTIQEVVDEHTAYGKKPSFVDSVGIEILDIKTKHLEILKRIMDAEGSNLRLIRLFTAEGAADALILAFAIAERDVRDTLFAEEYTIITNDTALSVAAAKYGIQCRKDLPNLRIHTNN